MGTAFRLGARLQCIFGREVQDESRWCRHLFNIPLKDRIEKQLRVKKRPNETMITAPRPLRASLEYENKSESFKQYQASHIRRCYDPHHA
jgi:hypothetical protein